MKDQKLNLAIKAFEELEENYVKNNHIHFDIKHQNMVKLTQNNQELIKFIDIPNYKFELQNGNTEKVKITQDSDQISWTESVLSEALSNNKNSKNNQLQIIKTFINKAFNLKNEFLDKSDFFCVDRLLLWSTLTEMDKKKIKNQNGEQYIRNQFLGQLIESDIDKEILSSIKESNSPFENIFLKTPNLLKSYLILIKFMMNN